MALSCMKVEAQQGGEEQGRPATFLVLLDGIKERLWDNMAPFECNHQHQQAAGAFSH